MSKKKDKKYNKKDVYDVGEAITDLGATEKARYRVRFVTQQGLTKGENKAPQEAVGE